ARHGGPPPPGPGRAPLPGTPGAGGGARRRRRPRAQPAPHQRHRLRGAAPPPARGPCDAPRARRDHRGERAHGGDRPQGGPHHPLRDEELRRQHQDRRSGEIERPRRPEGSSVTIRSSSRPPRPRAPFAHGGAERSAATEEPFASPPNSGTIRRATLPESILLMTLDAPLEQGPRVTARFLVRELSSLLPGLAVGLCLRTSSPSGHAVSLPWIEADYPVSVAEPGAEAPLRLFSSLEPELVLEIDGAGSTLHLA